MKGVMFMKSKNDCRLRILQLKPFINLKGICKAINLSSNSMYLFLKDEANNYMISLDKLNQFIEFAENL